MKISPVNKDNFHILQLWWELHKWAPIPLELLPQTGFIVSDGQTNICAGFLYETDSKFCLLEFVISNPLCDRLLRDRGLDLLLNTLVSNAKEKGFKAIFSSIKSESLKARYERHGAQRTDENMTNYVWSL